MEHDRDLTRLTLAALLGLDQPPEQLQPQRSAAYDAAPCTVDDARLKDALASRPDVRAAESTSRPPRRARDGRTPASSR